MPDAVLGRILRIVGARSLNTFGRQVINATVVWELYGDTHNFLVIAGLGLVQVVPVILLFVPAGTWVDRSDRRLLATWSVAITGLIGIGLALASAFGASALAFYALLFAQGCVNVVHAPSSASLIPLILPREQLERTNRITSSVQELAGIMGPALAGLALIWVAPQWNYAFVAVTGISSALMYRGLPPARTIAAATNNARSDWRVGLRFIWNSPLLLPALTLDMFAVLFAGVSSLTPAIATDLLHTNAFGYGVLRSAMSAGAVLAAVIGGRLPAWKRPGRVLLIVVALFGAGIVGIGLSRSLPLTVILLVFCGGLDNISVVIRATLEQLVVPDAIRGRVSAVHYVFIGMSNELGAAESGVAAFAIGPVPAIIAGGALAIVVVGIVAVKWRALAAMPPLAELKPADDG